MEKEEEEGNEEEEKAEKKEDAEEEKNVKEEKEENENESFPYLLAFINLRIMISRFLYMFYHWHNEV